MLDDALKSIVEGKSKENFCSSAEEISSDDQPLKSVAITSYEASKMLLDIEELFVSRGLHEEASIAHGLLNTANDISKKEMTQSKITIFF